jgi:hypothetical protein
MEEKIQFIGFTREEATLFIRKIVMDCLADLGDSSTAGENPLDIAEVCNILGVSAPTLKKFVDQRLIRRHDLGARKKVFYQSELQEDIKHLDTLKKRTFSQER